MICKRQEWIAILAEKSSAIAQLHLEQELIPEQDLLPPAKNLANSSEHNTLIIRATEELLRSQAASQEVTRELLKDIICRNTYGKFLELAAYDWIMREGIKITTQINLQTHQILGSNTASLDGKIDHCELYFDIKAFGFHGYLASILQNKLKAEIPTHDIFIEESWDLSVDDFSKLISDYRSIAQQLLAKRLFRQGKMLIRMKEKQPVSVSMRASDPYLLAKENSEYAFRSANQFTRNAPFLLIFALHPWFNQLTIHNDFAGHDSAFTRAFARRTFMQFTQDMRSVRTVCSEITGSTTFADAASLLSGIAFLNVWPFDLYPSGSSENNPVPSWIYLNPRASHKAPQSTLRMLGARHTTMDDFANDDY